MFRMGRPRDYLLVRGTQGEQATLLHCRRARGGVRLERRFLSHLRSIILAPGGWRRFRRHAQGRRYQPSCAGDYCKKAGLEDFSIRRRTIGIIESPAIVLVKSRIESQVLEQHVRDGQVVKKGDLLFTLDDREIQALIAHDEAQLAKDNAALAQAEADLGRKEELIEKNVAPRQQLDQATAVFKAAQQTVEADQAVLQADRLKLGYAKLEAPIAGRVGAIRVTPGNLVSVNDATGLVTITQVRPIRVGFTLAERDLTALRRASEASSPASARLHSGIEHPARGRRAGFRG
jgi:RND family efflux transporter MFP subunit